jgi:choice-of-anchor B domain-containing protein
VDVTDPALPFEVTSLTTVPRFDMKTWGSRVYSVDGVGGTGRVTNIATPASPVVTGSFPGGHNIFIDDDGFLYVCLPGLHIYDLNIDPDNPPLAYQNPSADGHDATVVGDILYEFRGTTGTVIWSVANRYAPVPIGAITDPTVSYYHNGWPSQDGNYLFITDELATDPDPDITVWNISNPASPSRVAEIFDPTASVHNCYVIGDVLFVAYYTAGFRIYDVSDPTDPQLLDTDDTSSSTGEGKFEGAWGVYPFSPDGSIYVNDRPNGLFVFKLDVSTAIAGGARTPALVMHANAPNPFSRQTTLRFAYAGDDAVEVAVFDAAGRMLRRLNASRDASGEHAVVWDGRGADGAALPSGVYFCRVSAGAESRSAKLVLLR